MYIELYEFIEGDEACVAGEYKGYVSLEEDDVFIDVDGDKVEEQLEELFSEPIIYSNTLMTEEIEAEPYTEEFFKNVLPLLRDYELRGILKEDETDEFHERVPESTEMLDEQEQEDEINLSLREIEGYEDEYDLDDEGEENLENIDLGEEEEEEEEEF